MFSSHDGLCTIGALAEHAGVSVKTVRFYTDRGLLPEASRSTGGHRRYAPAAAERLSLIRSLRGLDLPLPEVRRILDEQDAGGAADVLEDAIARRLHVLGRGLAALRWREAALRLVQECPPAERPNRLRLVGAVTAPPSTASLVRFWRSWLPPRMPARSVTAFLERAVPHPPDDPRQGQVLAFARLHAFVTQLRGGSSACRPRAHSAAGARESSVLYTGLAQAYDLAGGEMRRGAAPRSGEALDGFVDAYASAYGAHDTPAFRRGLGGRLAADPRIDRYWDLTTEVITAPGRPPEPTPGSAHDWLVDALNANLGATLEEGWARSSLSPTTCSEGQAH
ncbi:Mercuric resistance operon regulatory protein [Streptomyces sp. S4.7]|uniref:MerR family transcriptional regulator n=1 Tax=Streptomyces sp. S4.7 TaxID=2705439 RepID=UPI00139812AE|nr:MerR family transcriptional regulator [Streptomyces sp. S4.7]QHY98770.1 Mercuric resistance operon regulatory protein [Streptomyces sp. S4.7]